MFRNAIKAKYTVVFPETAPQKQEASIQELLLVEAQCSGTPRSPGYSPSGSVTAGSLWVLLLCKSSVRTASSINTPTSTFLSFSTLQLCITRHGGNMLKQFP